MLHDNNKVTTTDYRHMGEAHNPRPKDKGTAKGIGSYQ